VIDVLLALVYVLAHVDFGCKSESAREFDYVVGIFK
jgi:hypothetical protein